MAEKGGDGRLPNRKSGDDRLKSQDWGGGRLSGGGFSRGEEMIGDWRFSGLKDGGN